MKKRWRLGNSAGIICMMSVGMAMTSYAAGGWARDNNQEWHYYQSDGSLATETWKKSGNNYYYLDENGDMAKSQLIEHDDDYYYVNSVGTRVSNEWRYLQNEDPEEDEAEMVWYYFGSAGKAYKAPESGKTSFKAITIASGEVKKYAFDNEGKMLYGWIDEASERKNGDDAWKEGVYYCGDENDGAMTAGAWRELEADDDDNDSDQFNGTYWFCFNSNGKK